jgi:hypothetical protein
MRATTRASTTAAVLLALETISCVTESPKQRSTQSPGPYAPPPAYPNAQPAPYPPPPMVAPPQAAPASPSSGPDPIAAGDIRWLRSKAAALMQELVAVLPDDARRRVQSIPLVVDDNPGEVNAAAACVRGAAILVVSDGLLDITGRLSAARATDELFRTRKVDEYIAFLARHHRPRQPIPQPPPGFFDARLTSDPNWVRREQELLDETLGFVIGHELGHHRLGHLPCTAAPGVFGFGDVAREVSGAVPLFNQPNELAADVAGANNLLVVGARRQGYHLTEAGGLLVMQFFASVDQMSPEDILFSFDRTHPPPQVRVPVIQQTANLYRISGGWLPVPSF